MRKLIFMSGLVLVLSAVFITSNLFGSERQDKQNSKAKGSQTMPDKVQKSEQEWQSCLSPEQFRIMRQKGTERAYTGKYYKFDEPGTYLCAACGNELFSSDTKYDSGSGWPSFWDVLDGNKVEKETDTSLMMVRTEVLCSACGAHLGHVFEDGPKPTGLRYCINSAALKFKPAPKTDDSK